MDYLCSFCAAPTDKVKSIYTVNRWKRQYIWHCDDHEALAEQAIICRLKALGYFRQRDILKEPLFAVLPPVFIIDGVEWQLNKSHNGDYVEFVGRFEHDTSVWGIDLIDYKTGFQMSVPVISLKQFLPVEHQGLVDALLRSLN